MKNSMVIIMGFVLEKAADEPVNRRIKLYQALANACGDPAEEKSLNEMADALEDSDQLCREFEFSFNQNNPESTSKTHAPKKGGNGK